MVKTACLNGRMQLVLRIFVPLCVPRFTCIPRGRAHGNAKQEDVFMCREKYVVKCTSRATQPSSYFRICVTCVLNLFVCIYITPSVVAK